MEEMEESAEAAEFQAALEEQEPLWSGDEPESEPEPELDSPPAEPLEWAEAVIEAQAMPPEQAEAASAPTEGPSKRKEEVSGGEEEEEEEGVSSALPAACYCTVLDHNGQLR